MQRLANHELRSSPIDQGPIERCTAVDDLIPDLREWDTAKTMIG